MCKPWSMATRIDTATTRIDTADLPGRPCSVAAALDVVGDRWTMLVVREVYFGNHRFSDIARHTGAPRDRLTDRLNRLVEAGVLERRRYQDNPPRSGYHLTAAGKGLVPVLQALRQWGDDWAVQAPPVRVVHVTADRGHHEFHGEWVCRTCGERGVRTELEVIVAGASDGEVDQ